MEITSFEMATETEVSTLGGEAEPSWSVVTITARVVGHPNELNRLVDSSESVSAALSDAIRRTSTARGRHRAPRT